MAFYHSGLGIVNSGNPFELNGVSYPRNWLRSVSDADRAALGFIPVQYDSAPNSKFYFVGGESISIMNGVAVISRDSTPRELEDIPQVDENGDPVLDQDGVQVIQYGLKTSLIREAKAAAGSLLSQTDWMVIRATEDPTKPASAAILAYRAGIRTATDLYEADVTAALDIDQLQTITLVFPELP